MTDVFISYAREDKAVAQRIARAVAAEGYGVWWDDEIPPHVDYGEMIAAKIAAAKAAIVIWSRSAAASEWVRAEAVLSREGRKLIQTSIDGTALPLPFNLIQYVDIADWEGSPDHPAWKRVKASLEALCGSVSTQPSEAEPVAGVRMPPDVRTGPTVPSPPAEPQRMLHANPAVSGGKGKLVAGIAIGALFLIVLVVLSSWRAAAPDDGRTADVASGSKAEPVRDSGGTPAALVSAPQPSTSAFIREATIDDPQGFTNVRAGPSEGFGIIGRIARGETFRTYPQSGDWWEVRLRNGKVGYVAASRVRPVEGGPPDGRSMSMDGNWSVLWSVGETSYIGRLDVDGRTARLDVTFGDKRVRQDCAVETSGARVRIDCRNPSFVQGSGNYAADAFELTLTDSRLIRAHLRDSVNVTATVIFMRG